MAMVTLSMVLGAPQSDASGPTVVITDSLSPKSVSITPGTTVTWVNRDDKVHRLRAQDGGIEFDSKDLEPGDRWSHTFRDAGTASYGDVVRLVLGVQVDGRSVLSLSTEPR